MRSQEDPESWIPCHKPNLFTQPPLLPPRTHAQIYLFIYLGLFFFLSFFCRGVSRFVSTVSNRTVKKIKKKNQAASLSDDLITLNRMDAEDAEITPIPSAPRTSAESGWIAAACVLQHPGTNTVLSLPQIC